MTVGTAAERTDLVARIRQATGIDDPRILGAFQAVPRHRFVPQAQAEDAYDDRALPLPEGQTISQPSMIAIMLEALDIRPDQRVLEVGGGCGYAAALLGQLAREVHAVEIREQLAALAHTTLATLGISNVHVHLGDGRLGLPEHAPFDRILVSAGAGVVPDALLDQLAPAGRIAIPVGGEWGQTLMVGDKDAHGQVHWRRDIPCVFVPLVEG
jgi:protein-L-isoaspartate(D-aspartate) O-methyltransferase